MSSSISATTSTNTGRPSSTCARSADRRSSRSTTTGAGMRSTAPIPACRPPTRRRRSSRPGTITRWTTTTRTITRRTRNRGSRFSGDGRQRIAPITRTCRCAARRRRAGRRFASTARCASDGWRSSRCSTRASTGPISPAARRARRCARAPGPPAPPSSATSRNGGCSRASIDRAPVGTCWRSRCRSRRLTPRPARRSSCRWTSGPATTPIGGPCSGSSSAAGPPTPSSSPATSTPTGSAI